MSTSRTLQLVGIFATLSVISMYVLYRMGTSSDFSHLPGGGGSRKVKVTEYSAQAVLNHLSYLGRNDSQHCRVKSLDFHHLSLPSTILNSSLPLPTFQTSLNSIAHHHRNHFVIIPKKNDDCEVQFEQGANSTSHLLFVLVLSQFDHYFKRYIIRKTWGSLKSYQNTSLVYRFVIALPHSGDEKNTAVDITEEQASLVAEAEQYNDLIQVNISDKYESLTLKHLAALEYQQKYCSKATWVVKADEDIFLNVIALAKYVESNSKNDSIICPWLELSIPPSNVPKPHRKGRWGISEAEYPFREYPTFCHGQLYAYSAQLARKILNASHDLPCHMWLEDVYVSGVLAEFSGSTYPSTMEQNKWKDIPAPGGTKKAKDADTWPESGLYLRAHISGDDITQYRRQLMALWRQLMNHEETQRQWQETTLTTITSS